MMSVLTNTGLVQVLACAIPAIALAACGSAPTGTLPSLGKSAPQQPVSLTRAAPETPTAAAPALRAIDKDKVARAVERYRLNKGGKDAVHQIAGADLDGDGTPEALVHLSGEKWCAVTGCTLLVMRSGATGYNTISLVKRVRLPVGISPRSTSGWRDLLLATGQVGSIRLVTLKFNGSAYPGNASILPPVAPGEAAPPEIALRPARSIASTNAEAPGSNLIANQN